ncbi:MAG: MFS transporter, partial [Polaromonas sp.]|nr:MFS transporter [Polaromonas sp.]
GVAGVGGTLLGGCAADRFGAVRAMRVQLTLLVTMMAVLPLTRGHPLATQVTLTVWGLAGFGLMTPQQSLLASLSAAQAPLLLSLNASMLYVGTALGAVISGALLEPLGLARLGWAGLPFGLLALLTLAFDRAGPRPLPSAAASPAR